MFGFTRPSRPPSDRMRSSRGRRDSAAVAGNSRMVAALLAGVIATSSCPLAQAQAQATPTPTPTPTPSATPAVESTAKTQSTVKGREQGPDDAIGHAGARWSTNQGIGAGHCDRDAIEAPNTGLLLSTRLGGRLDERDRRCLGHVLELGTAGQQVGWTNATTRQAYAVAVSEYTPAGTGRVGARPGARERCRVLLLTTVGLGTGDDAGGAAGAGAVAGPGTTETLVACQANPGVWSIR
jgi:hypothetical protein